MSNYFKNKISYNHVMLLCIIASYFLIFLCFGFIIRNNSDTNVTAMATKEFLITLESRTNNDLEKKIVGIVENNDAELIGYELIEYDAIDGYFKTSLDTLASVGLSISDIFSNHARVTINSNDSNILGNIVNELGELSFVNDIEEIETIKSDKGIGNAQTKIPKILIIFLMSLVLFIIAIGLSLDFQRNRDSLKLLIRKGATFRFLLSKYLTKGFFLSFISWIIGVTLFILNFYLLRLDSYTDLRIFDIKFIGIVFLLPLALITFITSSVIWAKLMTLIKE